MKTLALTLLLSTSALAANSFPPCNGSFINEVWKAQDGTYWYCDGANWNAIASGIPIDGGYVDLSSNQTAAGSKTWTGDAGFNIVAAAFYNAAFDGGYSTGVQGFLAPKASGGDLEFLDAGSMINWEGAETPTIRLNHTWLNGGCSTAYLSIGTPNQPYLRARCTDGVISADFGFLTTGTASFAATTVTSLTAQDAGVHRLAADTDVEVAGQLVPTQHGATQAALEFGSDAGTNGALTVAFGTAFAAPPACFCQHVNTTNTSPCNLNSASLPATGTASFMVDAGGTDRITWLCMGSK